MISSCMMASNVITLFGNPPKLERCAIRSAVRLLQTVLGRQPVEGSDEEDEEDSEDGEDGDDDTRITAVRKWLDNNISSNSSIRQALWEQIETGDEKTEELLSLIFHPCLVRIDVTCQDRDDWPADSQPNPAIILKEIRRSTEGGAQLMTKRFHLQGYEYQCSFTSEIFAQLMSATSNIFPPTVWPKLTDLSLLNFDWNSVQLADFSLVGEDSSSSSDYYQSMIKFYQAIGQNLPSLTRLELTQPYNIVDDVYFWMFLTSPTQSFPEIPASVWRTGVLYNHRWVSKIRDPSGETDDHHPQLSLATVLSRDTLRNPICHSLDHLNLHGVTERLPVAAAILGWVPRLASLLLPECDLLEDSLHSAASQHYTNNFLLPALHLLRRHGSSTRLLGRAPGTNMRRLKIEEPTSVLMRDLWRHSGLQLSPGDPLWSVLDTVVTMAPRIQDLYLGNNAQHGTCPDLVLHHHHLLQLGSLKELTVLELESLELSTVEEMLTRLGSRLRRVTLTNICVDLGFVLSTLPQAHLLELRNTRVVLSDEEDDTRELPWSHITSTSSSLTELVIDYTVSLEVLYFCLTKVPSLTRLSVGHGRHRYSQRSSVRRLTPSRWEDLLAVSHLPVLQHLVIPVLFQPDLNSPQSTVSILDWEDVRKVFRTFPRLETAVLHRRQYQRSGDQSNFPFVLSDRRPELSSYPYRHIGYINLMDF